MDASPVLAEQPDLAGCRGAERRPRSERGPAAPSARAGRRWPRTSYWPPGAGGSAGRPAAAPPRARRRAVSSWIFPYGVTPLPLRADERQSSTAKRRSPRSRTVLTPAARWRRRLFDDVYHAVLARLFDPVQGPVRSVGAQVDVRVDQPRQHVPPGHLQHLAAIRCRRGARLHPGDAAVVDQHQRPTRHDPLPVERPARPDPEQRPSLISDPAHRYHPFCRAYSSTPAKHRRPRGRPAGFGSSPRPRRSSPLAGGTPAVFSPLSPLAVPLLLKPFFYIGALTRALPRPTRRPCPSPRSPHPPPSEKPARHRRAPRRRQPRPPSSR